MQQANNTAESASSGKISLIALIIILILSFALRLSNLGNVIDQQGAVLYDPDSCYHLFLIRQTLDHYPRVPAFDPGLAYPEGMANPWPPLFDLAAATFALPVKLLAGQRAADIALVLFGPLITSLVIIPMFFIARRWKDSLLALSSIIFYAVLSPSMIGLAGYLDHDSGVVLINLCLALAFISAVEKGRFFWLGIAVAALLLTWSGSLIYLVPMGIVSLLLYFRSKKNRPANVQDSRITVYKAGLGLVLGSGIYISGLIIWDPPYLWEASYVFPSIFQAEALLVFGIALFMLKGKRPAWQELGLSLLAGGICFFILPGMFEAAIEGLKYFSFEPAWLSSVTEDKPLLFVDGISFKRELSSLMERSGLLLFLLPLSCYLWLRRSRGPVDIFIALSALIFLLYGIRQIRYLPHAVPWLALTGGWLVAVICDRLTGYKRYSVFTLLCILVLLPAVKGIMRYPKIGSVTYNRVAANAAHWLGEYSQGRPGAVMVATYYGFAFRLYSDLPVVTGGKAVSSPSRGMTDTSRLYISDSVKEALDILDQRDVRYVVSIRPEYELDHDVAVLGRGLGELFEYVEDDQGESYIKPLEPFFRTMASKLYYRQWNPDNLVPPKSLSLIYPPQGDKMNPGLYPYIVLIYEYKKYPHVRR